MNLKERLASLTVEDPISGVHVKLGETIREEEGLLYVSLERGDSYLFGDYYGEYRGGYPWISEELETFAKENGGYWEWVNPGELVFSED